MDHSDLGNRMKEYEFPETSRKLMRSLPIYARIDGRSFSKFTRDMQRPFDARMQAAMVDTLKYLVDKSGATVGYTQSDEISLAWAHVDHTQEIWFGGKIHKLTSVLASMTTVAFVDGIMQHMPDWQSYLHRMPQFDCRVFQVPNLHELANCVLWRQLDCAKNAITQAAHAVVGPAQIEHKNSAQKLQILAEQGIQFDDYPEHFRMGVFVRRVKVARSFDPQQWASIPLQHRPNLGDMLMRHELQTFSLPPLQLLTNKCECLFDQATPQFKEAT